ncbi:unnamed protein product [Amoebophrya sp. A25]|nr:unnamed protein product [Amoebophrya sp. A25]|eukprot:GSA25T00019005001.1
MGAQSAKATQFYFEGRAKFNQNGYRAALESEPSKSRFAAVDNANHRGRVYMVTGANSGVGKEVVRHLAGHGAERVYMVCRSAERGEAARREILQEQEKNQSSSGSHEGTTDSDSSTIKDNVSVLQADCGEKESLNKMWAEFRSREKRLDGLVCNAGVLTWKPEYTKDGVETTMATHLIFGSHYLTQLALPMLEETGGSSSSTSRVVYTSSGGMYNSKWPGWGSLLSRQEEATPSKVKDFDGQMQYVYAKRGQVLLAEQLSSKETGEGGPTGGSKEEDQRVHFLSCHPGWAATAAVQSAYGSQAKWLEPMRTAYEGARGICWLLLPEATRDLDNGCFYLDCVSQEKHLSGFLGGADQTQNSESEIREFMQGLEQQASL